MSKKKGNNSKSKQPKQQQKKHAYYNEKKVTAENRDKDGSMKTSEKQDHVQEQVHMSTGKEGQRVTVMVITLSEAPINGLAFS